MLTQTHYSRLRLRLRRFICGFSRYIKIHKIHKPSSTNSNSNEATNNHNNRRQPVKSKNKNETVNPPGDLL